MNLTRQKLHEIETEAEEMLNEMGLSTPSKYTYDLNTRKNAAGLCSYRDKTIYMSTYVADFRSYDDCLNTMIHEKLHAICPKSGHTGEWKRLAQRVNSRYGLNIKRCYTPNEEQQQAAKERKLAKAKGKGYVIKCSCGFSQTATRKTRVVKTVLGESGGYLSIKCPRCKSETNFTAEKL